MMLPAITLGKDEVCYRVISPLYAATPLSGMGAARQGGRFNRPDQEALYLSMDRETAMDEYKQDNPWLPLGTICTFFVSGLQVADFRTGFDPGNWPSLWADFAVDWRAEWFDKGNEPPTWYMADDVISAGLDGLLFPSQARSGGTNLVIYQSSVRSATQLRVYDPDGALQKIAW